MTCVRRFACCRRGKEVQGSDSSRDRNSCSLAGCDALHLASLEQNIALFKGFGRNTPSRANFRNRKEELEGDSLAIQMLMIPGPSETEDAATATLAALEATRSEITSLQAARTAAAAAEAKAR